MSHEPAEDPFRPAGPAREEQLERMLAEAETAVSRLRRELADMRSRAVTDAEIEAQRAEIDRLSEHLSHAQVRWGEVWRFFETALLELRASQGDGVGTSRGDGVGTSRGDGVGPEDGRTAGPGEEGPGR